VRSVGEVWWGSGERTRVGGVQEVQDAVWSVARIEVSCGGVEEVVSYSGKDSCAHV
jgi:hypothetical protein